jgi:hypothetical protein
MYPESFEGFLTPKLVRPDGDESPLQSLRPRSATNRLTKDDPPAKRGEHRQAAGRAARHHKMS